MRTERMIFQGLYDKLEKVMFRFFHFVKKFRWYYLAKIQLKLSKNKNKVKNASENNQRSTKNPPNQKVCSQMFVTNQLMYCLVLNVQCSKE